MAEHHTRMAKVARVLLPSATGHRSHKSILIVTHVVPAITLIRALVGDMELSPRVGCGSLTELVRGRYPSANSPRASEDSAAGIGVWEPVVIAGTTHLSKGVLKDWGFEELTGVRVIFFLHFYTGLIKVNLGILLIFREGRASVRGSWNRG